MVEEKIILIDGIRWQPRSSMLRGCFYAIL